MVMAFINTMISSRMPVTAKVVSNLFIKINIPTIRNLCHFPSEVITPTKENSPSTIICQIIFNTGVIERIWTTGKELLCDFFNYRFSYGKGIHCTLIKLI